MADAVSNDDVFAYMSEECRISSSQEEILRRAPFVGEPPNSPHREASPPSSGGIPVASAGIIIASLTAETPQDAAGKDPQDVFHTPPEQSSLPTSQLSEYAEALELANLSDESELGFGQVKIKHVIEPIERESDESPRKTARLSERNPGVEENKSENEVAEGSDTGRELRVLPSSIRECMENKAKEKEDGNGRGEGNAIDYTVLRSLLPKKPEGDSVAKFSWLQHFYARGVDFPRPRWKREEDDNAMN